MHTFCHTKTHFNETPTSMVADAVKFVKILKTVSVIGRCIILFSFCCLLLKNHSYPFPLPHFNIEHGKSRKITHLFVHFHRIGVLRGNMRGNGMLIHQSQLYSPLLVFLSDEHTTSMTLFLFYSVHCLHPSVLHCAKSHHH